MLDSVRTLCRLAVVAAGVALAGQAHAATATLDCGAGTPSWNSSTNTLSCGSATTCVVSGPTSAQTGTSINLTATCPGSGTVTWTGTGATSCTGTTCSGVNVGTPGAVAYTAERGAGTVSAPHTVNWSDTGVVPSGCSLSVSPSSGAGGGPVTLTADCTTGTGTIDVVFSGSGTGGCSNPSQFTVAGSAATCSVTAPAGVTTTWQATFSNAAGSATNNPRSATYTYQAGGGGGFANCPAGSTTISNQWGAQTIYTAEHGGFGGQIISVQFTVPVGWSGGSKISSWVEFQDGGVMREWSLSSVACDFSSANALKTSLNEPMRGFSNLGFSVRYTSGSATMSYPKVVGGQTYYINMRNRKSDGSNSCTTGSCNMRGAIPN